jgi:hypothetical protein
MKYDQNSNAGYRIIYDLFYQFQFTYSTTNNSLWGTLAHWYCCFDTLFHLKLNYSQLKQIFGNCVVLDKTKYHFPFFISFVYLTLDDMAIRSKLQLCNKHNKIKFIAQ